MIDKNTYLPQEEVISVSTIAKKEKNRFSLLVVFITLIHISALYFFRESVYISIIIGFSGLITYFFLNRFIKRYSALKIKGDHLIIKSYKGVIKVASVRNIKKMSTLKIFDNHFVTVRYNLDGINYTIILLNNKVDVEAPETVLRTRLNEIKNKRQIYKPGSVSA